DGVDQLGVGGERALEIELLCGGRGALRVGVGDADEVEAAARCERRQVHRQRGDAGANHSGTESHASSGTAFSTISISSKRRPPGERRKATSRVPKPAVTRARGVTSLAPAAS